VIDAAANCAVMVHLPGKHALYCVMRNAASLRGVRPASALTNRIACSSLASMPSPRITMTAPHTAEPLFNR